MQVEFEQTPEDLVALWRFYLHRMPERRRTRILGFGVLFTSVAAICGLTVMALQPVAPGAAGPGGLAALIAVLAWPIFVVALLAGYVAWAHSVAGIRRRVRRQVRRGGIDPLFFGRKRVSIDTDGFRVAGDGFETFLAWRRVPRVVTGPDHVFLFQFYTPRNVLAHIVPRWAFASEFEFTEFARTAEEYWQRSRLAAEDR